MPASRLDSLIDQGNARPAKLDIAELDPPTVGSDLSATLAAMRDDERF